MFWVATMNVYKIVKENVTQDSCQIQNNLSCYLNLMIVASYVNAMHTHISKN
jgi:hypothetical protein